MVLLDHGGEHADLERLRPQVGDEARVGRDLAGVFPVTLQLAEQIEDVLEHLRVVLGHRAAFTGSCTVRATIRSPSRRVSTDTRCGPICTKTCARSASIASTVGASPPGARPEPSALPAASFAPPQRNAPSS